MERLVNCMLTRSHNSVLLRDCTPRATNSSSSSLPYNGSCTNLLTNVYKRRSAGKNKGNHVAGDISRNCVYSVLPPGEQVPNSQKHMLAIT